jgi:hypothetical protein
MPKLEPLPSSVVKSVHIGLGAQECIWLLVAISAAIRGNTRRSGARRFLDPLLAIRPAAAAALSFNPRRDPAHFRQKAQQELSRREGAS